MGDSETPLADFHATIYYYCPEDADNETLKYNQTSLSENISMHSVHIPLCAIGVFAAFVIAEHTSFFFNPTRNIAMIKMHQLLFKTVIMCAWDEWDLTEVLVLYSLTK